MWTRTRDMQTADRRIRPRRLLAALGFAGALWVGPAAAHDFWLVPNAFDAVAGQDVTIRGQTSSLFPTSVSAVTPDRVADARLLAVAGAVRLQHLDVSGHSLVLRARPSQAGQYVVAVRLAPRSVRESPASFRRYMELEGAPEALARYERAGALPKDSVTRRYAKYAKTFIEVGAGGPRSYSRAVGHPTELIPLDDPAALRAGDTLRVRFVFNGQPVGGAHLHAGRVPSRSSAEDTATARQHARADRSLTTDGNGVARVVIDREGLWNVRSLYIVPAPRGSGADWDVHWATIVFEARGSGAAPLPLSGTSGDSAAVVEVVRRYHDALETGDSTAAVRLLSHDVLILESGGVETLTEYRGHHLPADIAFARAVRSARTVRQVIVHGDAAWVSSTSVAQGQYNGRAINSRGAELMVLARGRDGQWSIRAIHWSSRAVR